MASVTIQAVLFLIVIGIKCIIVEAQLKKGLNVVGNSLVHARACDDNDDVLVAYETGKTLEEENQYYLYVNTNMSASHGASVTFDEPASVILENPEAARITPIGKVFYISFFRQGKINLRVKGEQGGKIPYIKNLEIESNPICKTYRKGYFDSYLTDTSDPDGSCGRRKVQHTQLIVSGLPTKPGDWPWHAALFEFDGRSLSYMCGGTLVSKTLVLTAAHCVTLRGIPRLRETINVVLGKYYLAGGDIAAQEREVFQIIVHESFRFKKLDNDIALLKLKSEAIFDDYVQPACLWSANAGKRVPQGDIFGTVVGWGLDQTKKLATELQQVNMPKVSETTCIKSNPLFYSKILNNQKFCAGYTNGTSACNGDSGGGYFVFVPDRRGDSSKNAVGSYHLVGVVSSIISRVDEAICDSYNYVIFTDVYKFNAWLSRYL